MQDAKARLSEVLGGPGQKAPDILQVHGQETAVLLSAEEFHRLKGGQTGQDLIDALQASPHPDIDLELHLSRRQCATWRCDGMVARYQRPVGVAPDQAGTKGRRVGSAAQPLGELFARIVTLAELRFRIERVSDPSARADLHDWMTHRVRPMFDGRVLPISEDVMFKWRLLVEDGQQVRHTFSQPDLIIAATALVHGLTVVTRNTSDFTRKHGPRYSIPGLTGSHRADDAPVPLDHERSARSCSHTLISD